MDNTPCTYRLSTKALIKDSNNKILLLREKDGSWELPGGGLEHSEDPKEGLAREIIEETGYEVVTISEDPIAFWTINKEVGSPTLKWFAFVLYEVQVSGDFQSQPNSLESTEAKYFSLREIHTLPLHDNTKPYFLT